MGREAVASVADNLQSASSPSSFVTQLWMWFCDEESRWHWFRYGRLVKCVAKRRISVPVGLTLASPRGIHTLGPRRQGRQVRRWSAAFGKNLLPTDVLHRLTDGLWQPNAVRVFISSAIDVKYCIVINHGTTPVAVGRRVIVRRKSEAFHHRMVTDERYQGRGLTSRLMANTIPLYEELGIGAVKLMAGLSAGSMVWPKFAFRPVSKGEWKRVQGGVRHNLRQLDHEFKRHFEDKTGEQIESYVERLLATQDPQAIWRVADLDERWSPIPGRERGQGLGSFLLQNIRWKGILDMNDPKAAARLRKRLERSEKAGLLQ